MNKTTAIRSYSVYHVLPEMVEIHSLISGDVSGDLFDLSIPVCHDHTLRYREFSGIEAPPEDVEAGREGHSCRERLHRDRFRG